MSASGKWTSAFIKDNIMKKNISFEDLGGSLPNFPYHISMGEFHEEFFTHTHDFSELFIILNGEATHLVDDISYRISAGDVYVIREKISHGFFNVKHLAICDIIINDRAFSDKYPDLKSLPGYQALFALEPYQRKEKRFRSCMHLDYTSLQDIIRKINDMFNEYYARREGFRSMFISGLLNVIICLSRQYPKTVNASGRKILNIANAVAYMESCYDTKIRIDDLARKAGMSERNFIRVFEQKYNMSPTEYLQKLRINKAAAMLKDTDLSITDIALENGYCDSTHFTRQFKSRFGITPTKYRKMKGL